MRGKESAVDYNVSYHGITPAYAGKSGSSSVMPHAPEDHPRVCGEKKGKTTEELHEAGSPPRMRGKGKAALEWKLKYRITPAYAGKSSTSWNRPQA